MYHLKVGLIILEIYGISWFPVLQGKDGGCSTFHACSLFLKSSCADPEHRSEKKPGGFQREGEEEHKGCSASVKGSE